MDGWMDGWEDWRMDGWFSAPLAATEPSKYRVFAAQRDRWPPLTPQEIMAEQSKPDYELPGGEFAVDLAFSCPAPVYEDQLYLWYRELARAGFFVDLLYWGTPHAQLINAMGYKGSAAVPAISTQAGPSLNWHVTTNGRIRVDGRAEARDVITSMLRRAFQPLALGPSLHASFTGRSSKSTPAPSTAQDALRAEWAAARRGQVLVIDAGRIFDPAGTAGIWDVLDREVGTKAVTTNTAIPWVILTRTRVGVSINTDGRIQLQIGTCTVEAATTVENLLTSKCGARWIAASSLKDHSAKRVTFGSPSPAATVRKSALAQSVFR